jgi:pimeloyl-ACP methyl ester carboxylesterase
MFSIKKKAALLILAGALAAPAFALAQEPTPAAAAAQSFSNVERRALTANVAEYSFKVRVGTGPYDEIGVHRVVKEIAPNVPARAAKAVFLAPGDIWNFRAAFLTGAKPLPVFLAENGVDVWGIDYRWTSVPVTETDLSFMADWGIEQDARDLGFALGVARFTRAMTGSGFGKIHLLGWSRGGQISYAYLNGETQVPAGLRQVAGFIPVDIYLKTDVQQLKDFACQRQQNNEALLASGKTAADVGGLVSILGTLAATDPNGSSILNGPPFNLPGYTNREAGLLVGEATFALQGGLVTAPFYHFTGGTFGADGKPTGLLYSNEADLFSFEQGASPFQPNRELAEADAATCEQTDVAFDDHLAEITVPVLYIGAGGGFGEFGIYTTTLLGSTDVTTHVVSLVPAEARIVDFGHADLFLANNAQALVWQPLLDWVKAH